METTKTKKMSLILSVSAIAFVLASVFLPDGNLQPSKENSLIRSIKAKLENYFSHVKPEQLYLHIDKPIYQPGDDIWLSAYIREAGTLDPSLQSDIVYVELISPKGTVEKKINLIAKKGKAAGDFLLDEEMVGGIYKLRAYTNWMKNNGEKYYYEREVQIQDVMLPALKMKLDFEKKAFGKGDEVTAKLELQTNENKVLSNQKIKFAVDINGQKYLAEVSETDENGLAYIRFSLPTDLKSNDGLLNVLIEYNGSTESISRSIPIVLNTINFTAFPEGGDMLLGAENKIAFKALNEFGKPADIEGYVVTEKGTKVVTFLSFHQGMGAFKLVPIEGEKYFVKITKPKGIDEKYMLPEALKRGYAMSLDNSQNGIIKMDVSTTETENLSLIAQVRGTIYYTTEFTSMPGKTSVAFSTDNFPIGVTQLTLFDSRGIARAERLVFVNKHKQMDISIQTDKQKYLPREKVKMTLTVKDERGLPMPANLSMAVVNDQLLSFAADKSGNILSQLLLENDLKEKVEEAAFYFDKNEKKANQALDYLLMTSGWRRFTWEKIIEQELPPINFMAEKAMVSGNILDAYTGVVVPNASIKNGETLLTKTNAKGEYTLSGIELYAPIDLSIVCDGYVNQNFTTQTYGSNQNVYVYSEKHKHQLHSQQEVMLLEKTIVQLAPAHNVNASGINDDVRIIRSHVKKSRAKDINVPKKDELVAANVDAINHKEDIMEIAAAAPMAGVDFVEDRRFRGEPIRLDKNKALVVTYVRAREFPQKMYAKNEAVETRSDFRNTIYWNPTIEVGHSGKKTLEFFTSDDITSFNVSVEGIGIGGMLGRCEEKFYTQLPFELTTKIPAEVITEDIISIPITLKNNTNGPLGGELTINSPKGFETMERQNTVQTIMPGVAKTIYLKYKVLDVPGEGELKIAFKSCGLTDAFSKSIKITSKGFPVQLSFSAQEMEKEYSFTTAHIVNGSLKATLSAYPNVVNDLMKGVEGILQEPYGCFEQTSCTAYPNAMVLDYLKHTGSKDTKLLARAEDLLDRGYKRLTTFETSTKGYEWFGANPAHEGLTAYGIMEFVDMQKAGQAIDQEMLDRTAKWLLSHKDGKGGFERERRALHDFGRISDEVLNGYIVYAMTEAGYTDLKREFETSFEKAMDLKDPYLLAMVSSAAFNLKNESKGEAALKALLSFQKNDGSISGSSHSITYSQGRSLSIETTALTVLAILKSKNVNQNSLNKAVQFIVAERSGSGVFSSTQGTILALKALTAYAKHSKKTVEDGKIIVFIDNEKVSEKFFKAGEKNTIIIDGLEKHINKEGVHKIKVRFVDVKNALPYSVSVAYNTTLPIGNDACKIDLESSLSNTLVNVGETVRLKTIITNKSAEEVPSTIAIIGIPSGLSVQPWQLKELQEKNVFDYYEIKGNNIAIYYRGLESKATREIALDLKAEIPGLFEAPASSAYLYYTNEFKTWKKVANIKIKA